MMLPNVRVQVLQASAAHFSQASTFIFSVFAVSLQFNKVVVEEEAASKNVVTLSFAYIVLNAPLSIFLGINI